MHDYRTYFTWGIHIAIICWLIFIVVYPKKTDKKLFAVMFVTNIILWVLYIPYTYLLNKYYVANIENNLLIEVGFVSLILLPIVLLIIGLRQL